MQTKKIEQPEQLENTPAVEAPQATKEKLDNASKESTQENLSELQSHVENKTTYNLIALEKDVEKREQMLQEAMDNNLLTAHEVMSLKSTILPDAKETKDPSWLKKQRNGLTSKDEWKNHTGANVLRAVSGLGIGVLAYKGFKAIKDWFSDWREKRREKKEAKKAKKEGKSDVTNENNESVETTKKEKKGWFARNRGWVAGGGAAVAAGLGYLYGEKIFQIPYIGPFLDKIFNPNKLTMEEAIIKAKAELNNKTSDEYVKTGVGLEWNETTSELTSYGNTLKIDTTYRKIEGLNVVFPTFEELIHAANIINYSYTTFKGRCATTTPFSITSLGGDIEVTLVNDDTKEVATGSGVKVGTISGSVVGSMAAVAAGYATRNVGVGLTTATGAIPAGAILGNQLLDHNDTLSKVCPTLNNKNNKDRFLGYLNSLPNLTQGNQTIDPGKTSNETINQTINKIKSEIEATIDKNDPTVRQQGTERIIEIVDDKTLPSNYLLTAWGHEMLLHIQVDTNNTITHVALEDSGVQFPVQGNGEKALREAIYLATSTTKFIKEAWGKGAPKNPEPFAYNDGLLWKLPALVPGTGGKKEGLYFDKKGSSFDRILSKEAIEKNMPSLLQGNNMKAYIARLNSMRNNNNALYWTINSGDGRKSTYANRIMK